MNPIFSDDLADKCIDVVDSVELRETLEHGNRPKQRS